MVLFFVLRAFLRRVSFGGNRKATLRSAAYFGILTDPTCSTSIRKLSPDSNPSLPHIQPEHCRLLPTSECDMQGWEGAQLAHPPCCLPTASEEGRTPEAGQNSLAPSSIVQLKGHLNQRSSPDGSVCLYVRLSRRAGSAVGNYGDVVTASNRETCEILLQVPSH